MRIHVQVLAEAVQYCLTGGTDHVVNLGNVAAHLETNPSVTKPAVIKPSVTPPPRAAQGEYGAGTAPGRSTSSYRPGTAPGGAMTARPEMIMSGHGPGVPGQGVRRPSSNQSARG